MISLFISNLFDDNKKESSGVDTPVVGVLRTLLIIPDLSHKETRCGSGFEEREIEAKPSISSFFLCILLLQVVVYLEDVLRIIAMILVKHPSQTLISS
jgi:hypothetical protein